MKKVVVAMSGGVDSSTAAYLLIKQGMAVEGVFFVLFDNPSNLELAEQTARFLGIKLHIKDLKEYFKEKVIKPFFKGYSQGITPNPCIICNRYIKFHVLAKLADLTKAQFIATGHYARISRENDDVFLLKGVDNKKDQSYFLYGIDKSLLNHIVFPLGQYTKDEVKKIAETLNLPSKVAEESLEICFLKEKKYYEMMKAASGPIIEKSTGKTVGQHGGIHLFTIGQRKRIGVSVGYPAYVVQIEPSINAVYIASRKDAYMREFYVDDSNWLCEPAENKFKCEVKIRYAMKPERASITLINNHRLKITFDNPQFAPTPGQSAVFYEGEKVLGGGVITELVQDS